MNIRVKADQKEIVFQLNESTASNELLTQLPLEIKVENFGNIEKIYYPPGKLNAVDAPLANAKASAFITTKTVRLFVLKSEVEERHDVG